MGRHRVGRRMAMGEEGHAGHAHDAPGEGHLPPAAWGVVALVAAVVLGAWAVTLLTAGDYMRLLEAQVAGAAPVDTALYLALSGTMMVAMMLPSALPMLRTYRGLAALDEAGDGAARTALFTAGYFVVWTAFTALSLAALMAFGLLGTQGLAAYVPGALLVAAGAYQLTGWKAFCLRHCRTPMGFLMGHWRKGRAGALRMGLEHAVYCLGCCWLLMLVLFTAGAMSVLWMGLFAGLVLVEKVGPSGERFSRALGLAGIAVGLLALGYAWAAPVSVPVGEMGGMAGM